MRVKTSSNRCCFVRQPREGFLQSTSQLVSCISCVIATCSVGSFPNRSRSRSIFVAALKTRCACAYQLCATAVLCRRITPMKGTSRMRTSQPHWLPFACNKRLGPRMVVKNGLGRVGMERTVPSMGLEEAALLKRGFSHRLVIKTSSWSS